MILYSKQLFFYILKHHDSLIEKVFLSKEIDPVLFRQIRTAYKGEILRLDNKKAQAMAKGNNHQGFLFQIKTQYLCNINEMNLKDSNFILVLDAITDVGNIGNIIRSAYCLGVDGIIITGIKTIPIEPIIRTSVGAFFEIPVMCFKDTLDILSRLKEQKFSLYGAVMDALDVKEMSFESKKVLVMGNEHTGLSNKVLRKLDKHISIKMANSFDSLNVSTACAILAHEMN